MDQYPLIKIEIDQMKHTILHHFNSYQKNISDYVKEQIESAVKNYDFEGEVKQAVYQVISRSLEDYFKWGDGNKLISNALNEALSKAFNINIDELDLFIKKPK